MVKAIIAAPECRAHPGGTAPALGADVVLLERSAAPRTSGYMIDFFGAGYEAAEAIGVLPAIEEVSYRIGDAGLVDQHGRRRGDLPHQQIAKALDGRLCSVMRSDLENVLRDKVPGSVDVRFGTSVAEVSQQDDRVTVTLDDGAELDADLLVGADGIHSAVRALVFGDDREQLKYLGFHFAAFEIDASDLPDPPGDRFVCTDALDRQLSFYVLRDGRAAVSADIARPARIWQVTPVPPSGTDTTAWAGWCPRCSSDAQRLRTSATTRQCRLRCPVGARTESF